MGRPLALGRDHWPGLDMNLPRKFVIWVVILLVGLVSTGGVSVWNLLSLASAARGAAAEYSAMDQADATAAQIGWLRDVLAGPDAGAYRETRFFTAIRRDVVRIVEDLQLGASLDDTDTPAELDAALRAQKHVESAYATFTSQTDSARPTVSAVSVPALHEAAKDLTEARATLLNIVQSVPISARRHVMGEDARLQNRLMWTLAWLAIVLVVSLAVHAAQYRALVKPLVWLRDDMKQSAAAGYRELVRVRGEFEFADVTGLFNDLVKDLAQLYRGLEEKVIQRSRELVRSERLASVGFLAAGVAHEINNPLSVISGYAELASKKLERVLDSDGGHGSPDEAASAAEAEALGTALDAQTIIRDEAFRCKEITGRLLSLARGGADSRQPLQMNVVAEQVATLTHGLRNYRDRKIRLNFQPDASLDVLANPVEMKQVLLNLTVNALEASPSAGEVRIDGRRSGDWVELSVEDNGRGMSAETLEQIFEPFFTAKRGAGEPGTGLGLSITHAIVENHGGRIRAESAGPGKGSKFVVSLPVMKAIPMRVVSA